MAVIAEEGKSLLQQLKRIGLLGLPVVNIANSKLNDMEPVDFADTMRALEKKGYIKIYGKRTLDDFYALLDEKASVLVPLAVQNSKRIPYGDSYMMQGGDMNHYHLYDKSHDFFYMAARLTLKGRFALAAGRFSVDENANAGFDLQAAKQNLAQKRAAENSRFSPR